jgi:hypothetical protein
MFYNTTPKTASKFDKWTSQDLSYHFSPDGYGNWECVHCKKQFQGQKKTPKRWNHHLAGIAMDNDSVSFCNYTSTLKKSQVQPVFEKLVRDQKKQKADQIKKTKAIRRSIKSGQRNLIKMFESKDKSLDMLFTKFIVSSDLSFSVTENRYLKEFLTLLSKGKYETPSRKMVKEKLLPKLAEYYKAGQKEVGVDPRLGTTLIADGATIGRIATMNCLEFSPQYGFTVKKILSWDSQLKPYQMKTGQAIECIAMTMLVYLVISLSISTVMNIYNRP